MDKVKFDPKELEVVETIPPVYPGRPSIPVFNTPISRKENFRRLVNSENPLWLTHPNEIVALMPSCMPDNWARGMVSATKRVTPDMYGGKDMFNVEWEYDAQTHGSMVRPGAPHVGDLERWEDYISFPNIDEWDWEGDAKAYAGILSDGRIVKVSMMNGLFERLVTFVDMTDAMIALIDEDCQIAVHRLFDKLSDLYERIFEKFENYFHPDIVWFHDDWGSQRAPLFSADTVQEMILPYLKRIVESAHKHGMFFELHSCGKIEQLVPIMIKAGVDLWNGQPMNDKLMVAKTYGDKIICDPVIQPIEPNASREELVAHVQAFLNEYIGLRICVGKQKSTHPLEQEVFYELSRKALSK